MRFKLMGVLGVMLFGCFFSLAWGLGSHRNCRASIQLDNETDHPWQISLKPIYGSVNPKMGESKTLSQFSIDAYNSTAFALYPDGCKTLNPWGHPEWCGDNVHNEPQPGSYTKFKVLGSAVDVYSPVKDFGSDNEVVLMNDDHHKLKGMSWPWTMYSSFTANNQEDPSLNFISLKIDKAPVESCESEPVMVLVANDPPFKLMNTVDVSGQYRLVFLPPPQRLLSVRVSFANQAAFKKFAPMAKQSVADIDPSLIAKLGAIENSYPGDEAKAMDAMNQLQSVVVDPDHENTLLFLFSMVCDSTADTTCNIEAPDKT
jgi:hypothetical protein